MQSRSIGSAVIPTNREWSRERGANPSAPTVTAEPAGTPRHVSEVSLIQAAQNGDSSAISHLYQCYAGEVFRYCLYRVGDRAVAEDLAGEVFLKMLEGLSRYTYQGIPFSAWLYRIAHDRVVDYHRRQVHRQAEELDEHLVDAEPAPEDQVLEQTSVEHLAWALARLPDEQLRLVQLRFVEEYTLQEAADRMGKTLGAVKALQCRALRRLAREMGRGGGPQAP